MSWKIEKDLCRCCHAEGSFQNLTEPLSNLGQQEVYSDMLQQTLNININPVEGIHCAMTFTICENCILRLRDASNFKRQVLLCEDRFKDMFKSVIKALSPNIVKDEVAPASTDVKEIKVEPEGLEDDDEEESFHLRFEDSDEEEIVVDVKLEERKKVKGKRKLKPQPNPSKRPKKSTTKKTVQTSKDADAVLPKQPDVKQHKGRMIEDHRFTLIIEDGTKSYKCKICSKIFKEHRNVSQHYKHVHLKQRPKKRSCHMCRLKIAPHKRAAHREEAHGLPAPLCGICNRKFAYPHQLLRHQKVVHMGERQFECDSCNLKFATQSNLDYHRVKHTGIRMYECTYCDKTFTWKKNLKTHVMMHLNDKRQVCPICQERFVQSSSLKYHMWKRHPEAV